VRKQCGAKAMGKVLNPNRDEGSFDIRHPVQTEAFDDGRIQLSRLAPNSRACHGTNAPPPNICQLCSVLGVRQISDPERTRPEVSLPYSWARRSRTVSRNCPHS